MDDGQCQGLLSSGSPVINNVRPHPLIAPIRHNRFQQLIFFSPFEVEEILQQGQQQRLDVGSLQEFLGIKKNIDLWKQVWTDLFFFPVCDR